MTKKETENAFTDVAGLMAERHQIEAWLAALDARRDGTPRHVFQRVRSDYETRLKQVLELLSSHRSELEERLVTLTKRVTTLEAEEQAKRDERAELELRAAVGELSPEGYEKQAAECDRLIAEVSAQRTSVREEAERTRDFLQAAVRPSPALQQEAVAPERGAAAAQSPAAAGTPSAASPAQPASASETAPTAAPASKPTPAAPARGPGFDELAFLNAVVGDGSGELPPQRVSQERPAVTEPEPPRAEPARAEPPRVPRLEPRVSRPAPRVSGPRRSSKPDWIAKEPMETLDTMTPDADANAVEKETEAPLAANISGNHPIVLRSSGQVDQSKTLKCAECGTMNYPTEWYCERCGAELAAL